MTTTEVEGLTTFDATTRQAIEGLENLDGDEAGRVVQLRASANAPKATGLLSRSIHATSSGTEVTVSADTPYSAFPEFGTRYMAAHPYMRPALVDSQSAVAEVYARDVRTEVGHIHGA